MVPARTPTCTLYLWQELASAGSQPEPKALSHGQRFVLLPTVSKIPQDRRKTAPTSPASDPVAQMFSTVDNLTEGASQISANSPVPSISYQIHTLPAITTTARNATVTGVTTSTLVTHGFSAGHHPQGQMGTVESPITAGNTPERSDPMG